MNESLFITRKGLGRDPPLNRQQKPVAISVILENILCILGFACSSACVYRLVAYVLPQDKKYLRLGGIGLALKA